ncbi:hypothetical protein EDD21DRAFT_179503 [Dissophora ornata]|nr:hypothetical protein EDD21DRAFT_179503 [Dissophora ornata]
MLIWRRRVVGCRVASHIVICFFPFFRAIHFHFSLCIIPCCCHSMKSHNNKLLTYQEYFRHRKQDASDGINPHSGGLESHLKVWSSCAA